MTTSKSNRTTWQPGQSGNPTGRPRGSGEVAELRAAIREHVPDILDALVERAQAGDVQAARLLLERTLPAIRPTEHAKPLALPDGTLTTQGRAVLAAVGAGELGPQQGAQLLSAIGTLARIVEVQELEKRLDALERAQEHKA